MAGIVLYAGSLRHVARSTVISRLFGRRYAAVGGALGLSQQETAELLLVSERTLSRPRLVTMELVVLPCRFEEDLLETVAAYAERLPSDRRAFPWPASTQQIGQRWKELPSEPRTPAFCGGHRGGT